MQTGGFDIITGFEGAGGDLANFGNVVRLTTPNAERGSFASHTFLQIEHNPRQPHNYAGAAYFGTQVQPAGGDSYSVNIGNYVEPGVGRDTTAQDAMRASTNHFGLEIDQGNNSRVSYGDNPFDFSIPYGNVGEFAPIKIIGHSATGSRGTAAILAYGLGGGVWNRGIAFDGDSIVTATFQDSTNADTVILADGAHRQGADFSRATGMQGALLVPNNSWLGLQRYQGDGFIKIQAGIDNILTIGENSAGIRVYSSLYPAISGGSDIGTPTHMMAGVYAERFYTTPATHWASAPGSPEGVVTAGAGSLYTDTNGGPATLYVKTSGSGNTGWKAIATP